MQERRIGVIRGCTQVITKPETSMDQKPKVIIVKREEIGITDAGIPVVFPNGHREIRFDVAAKIPELKNW